MWTVANITQGAMRFFLNLGQNCEFIHFSYERERALPSWNSQGNWRVKSAFSCDNHLVECKSYMQKTRTGRKSQMKYKIYLVALLALLRKHIIFNKLLSKSKQSSHISLKAQPAAARIYIAVKISPSRQHRMKI